eukprot:4621603-Prymnesium_polylepis.1
MVLYWYRQIACVRRHVRSCHTWCRGGGPNWGKIRKHSSIPPCQHVSQNSRMPGSGIIPACRHAS